MVQLLPGRRAVRLMHPEQERALREPSKKGKRVPFRSDALPSWSPGTHAAFVSGAGLPNAVRSWVRHGSARCSSSTCLLARGLQLCFITRVPEVPLTGVYSRRSRRAAGVALPRLALRAAANELPSQARTRGAELAEAVRREYPQMFNPSYTPDWALYDERIVFEDPITRLEGIGAYRRNIEFLRQSPVFGDGRLLLHDLSMPQPCTLCTRWTLSLRAKFFPFQPLVIFTGTSTYEWSADHGRIVSHIDRWDSIQRQAYFSPEGLRDLLMQLFRQPFRNLEGTILYRFRDIMIVQQRDGAVIARGVYRALSLAELEAQLEKTFPVHGYRAVSEENDAERSNATGRVRVQVRKADPSRKP